MQPLSSVLNILRAGDTTSPWLTFLESIGPATVAYETPSPANLVGRLAWCGVPEGVIAEIASLAPAINADDDLAWLLDRSVQHLWQSVDRIDWPHRIPRLPEELGPLGRWFFAIVFATFLPLTLDLHRQRGISPDISQATLADIGRHVRIHEARHGIPGQADPDWLALHVRGVIYQTGRLQFERARLGGTTSRALHAQGYDYQHGEPVLSVHIPGYMGPLDPAACDAAFAHARAFFATHYPEERYRLAVCKSWLLDRQLATLLPATSNIVRFQHRFGLAYTPDQPDDHDTLEFVFRTPNRPLADLPQNTTLERAVVAHLQQGGHFFGGMGWLPLT